MKVARTEEETPAVEAPKMEDQQETVDVTANDEQTETDEDETEDEVTEEDEETEEDEGTSIFSFHLRFPISDFIITSHSYCTAQK